MHICILIPASAIRDYLSANCATPSGPGQRTLCLEASAGLWSVLCGTAPRFCRLWPHAKWGPGCRGRCRTCGERAAQGWASSALWSFAGEPPSYPPAGLLHSVLSVTSTSVRSVSSSGSFPHRGLLFLQPGDVVLHVNGESTQGLSHGQVVERIRAGGPRLSLVLCRPLEMQPQKAEGTARPHKGGGRSPKGRRLRDLAGFPGWRSWVHGWKGFGGAEW